jgi:uncharacterized membrane protein
MARLLIAAFQGLVLQQAWDARVDAAACAGALATLIAPPGGANMRRGHRALKST